MATTTAAPNITQPPINQIPADLLPRFDPDYVALYNAHNVGRFQTHQVPIEAYRADPSKYVISYGRQFVEPAGLRITDQTCPVEGGQIKIRICEPSSSPSGKRPAYMNFHGGGWVFGDLEVGHNFCKRVSLELDCVTLDVDYRLAPEHRFPVPVDDCWAAFQWMVAKADELHIDTARLAVGGCSAGGHMAAIVSHLCRDAGIPLAFQVLAVPVTDLHVYSAKDGSLVDNCPYASYRDMPHTVPLSYDRMRWFHNHFVGLPRPAACDDPDSDAYWKLSPIRAPNFQGIAPALIVTAEMDVLRDEGEAYGAKMNAASSHAEVIRMPGAPHSFSTIDQGLAIGRQYNQHALRALGAAFGVVPKSQAVKTS